ncbi:unnamed protein product [Effrenium voratum]|uniref:protein-tyrosine-phosphatase n=1 Tax=Effrenium voratum TaxID=2562239 RepID=A0AA36HTW2_9DINO|nr:unnamed protein product [Effrenium voratum]
MLTMELNEKGLWVRKKKPAGPAEEAPGPSESAKQLLKTTSSAEDPRLEAAKPKGRGTADATEKALQALQERRKLERKVQDEPRTWRERGWRRPSGEGRDLAGKLQDGGAKLNGYTAPHAVDFDDEARKLWVRLNLDPSIITGGQYNAMDALWQHPETRAVFYVGNQTAATNLSLLQKHGVTHVVNCTDSMPNYHENYPSGIKYHRFDISSFHRRVKSDADAARFVQPMLDFVSSALADGKNVMVHCLAGAHRAGTTGCMCLMYFAQLGAKDAVLAGVQRSDEEAKEVVERALGSCAVGQGSAPVRAEPTATRAKRRRSPSPVAVSSPSENEGGDFQAAWMDSDDEKEAAKLSEKPSGGDIVVDFF